MKTATTTSPPTPSMMEALSAKLRQPTLVRTVTTTVVGAAIFSLCMCDPFGLPTRGTLGSLAWVFTYSTLKPNIGPSEYGKLIDGSIKFLLLLCLCSVLAMAMVASSRGHPEALMAWTSVLAVFYCAIASWDSSWFGAGVVCALMTYLFAFIPYSQAPPWSEKYPTRELQFHVQWVVLTGSITSVLTSATLGIAVACGVHGLVLPDFGCVKWRRTTAAVLSSTAKLLDDVAARAIITSARRVDVDSPARLAQSMGTIRGQLAALSPALGAARLEWRFFSPRRGQLASQLQVAVQVAVGHALENATAAAQAGHTMSKHLGADEPLQAACQRTLQESRKAITDLATALGTGGAKGTQPAEPLPPPFPVGESLNESLDEALGAALRRVAHKSDDAIEQLVTAHQAAAFHVTLRSLRAATTRLSAAGKAFVGEPEASIFSPAGWAALRAEWAATCPVPRRPRAASDLLVASPLAPVSRHRHLLRSFMAFLSSERATTAWKVALALVLTSMWGFFEWANPVYVKMGGVSAIASVVTLSVSPQVGALGWKAVAKVAGNLVAVAFAFVWYGLFVSTGTAAAQDSGGDIGSGAPTDTGLRDAEEFLSDPLLLGGMVLFQGLLQAACCLFVAAYPSMSYAAYITVIMWVTATNKKLTPSGQNGAQLVSFAVYARTVSIELLGAATGLCMAFLTCSLINPTWGYASVSNALAEVAATCQAALVHANELRRGGATQKDSAAAIARARLLVQVLVSPFLG